MNDDAADFMEQLNVSHTLGLDDIAMSLPSTQKAKSPGGGRGRGESSKQEEEYVLELQDQ